MGNQPQKNQTNGEVTISVNHPKFNNAKLITEAAQKQIQLTMGVDQKEYDRWKQSKNKANLDTTSLLLPKKQDFSRKGLCGDSGTLKLNFDNYSYLLTEEIYNRNGRKAKFQEWELWYLLLSLSAAQQEMKRKTGSKVGDIRPHNVFLNADGDIKISNVFSWPRESTNFNKTFDNQKTYLAPEDMDRIEMGTMEDSSNYSSEVFSIGLTVLSAAMLQDFLNLYDVKSYKFNAVQAGKYLDQWRSNNVYSQIFTAFVSNLCEFQPQKRLQDKELWQWISKYEKPIRDKEDFAIEEAPTKIEQQIEAIRRQFPAEEPQVYQQGMELQQGQYIQHPFPQKSMVQSYIPPQQYYAGQHQYLPPNYVQNGQQEIQRISSPRMQGQVERVFIDDSQRLEPVQTRLKAGSPVYRASEPINMGQYRQAPQGQVFLPPQYMGGRVIGEHELPPEYVRRTVAENQLPPEFARRQVYQAQGPPQHIIRGQGQSQYQGEFIGRPIPEGQFPPQFLPRGQVEGSYPQIIGRPIPENQMPPGLIGRSQGGETQMPPQFIGRTINETYLSPHDGRPIQQLPQGYIPQGVQYVQGGQMDRRSVQGVPKGGQGLSYFQNMVDPQGVKGGRIEQTIYIQKPQLGQQYQYEEQ